MFCDHDATLSEIGDALRGNFEGYETLREKLLAAPKYGNNDLFVDKYAVWFVDYLYSLFEPFRTYDGGRIYIAMAANTSNIWAGRQISATPDGRLAGEPLSDAASPTYGRDKHGVTEVINSVTHPDYTKVACGTVLNQKFTPSAFEGANPRKAARAAACLLQEGRTGDADKLDVARGAARRDGASGEVSESCSARIRFLGILCDARPIGSLDILARTQQE